MAGDLLLGTLELLAPDPSFPLPERFMATFAAGGVVTIWLDGCLALWPAPTWTALADRLVALPTGVADARAFGRLLFASAVEVPFGAPVPLPSAHRTYAGIDDRVVLVGAGDHVELWAPERWAAQSARSLDDLVLPVAV